MPTVRVRPAPVILLVGCTPAFVRRCNEAAVQSRAIAVETDLTSFATLATQTRARAVLMPHAMYSSSAALFDAMVAAAGTRLVTFPSEAIAPEPLADLILGAVEHTGPDTEPGPSGR
jgi:hypothetical protein